MNNQFIAAFDNLRSNLGILARAVQEQSKQIKEFENRFRLLEAIKSPQSSDFDDKILKLKNDILSSVDDKLKNNIEKLIDDKIKISSDLIDDKIKKSIISDDKINILVTDILNKAINPILLDESVSASVSVDNSTDDISIVEPTPAKPARKSRAKKAT